VEIAAVGANVMAFTDAGLAAEGTYRYHLRATNADGDSSFSNAASATAP